MEKFFINNGQNMFIKSANQEEIYKDVYSFGKQIYEQKNDFGGININRWRSVNHIKINGERISISALDKTLTKFLAEDSVIKNASIKSRFYELCEKYKDYLGYESKELLKASLYVYIIDDLIKLYNSAKNSNDIIDYSNSFLYFKAKKEKLLCIIKDIINSKLHLNIILTYYELDIEYLFLYWYQISYLTLYKKMIEITNSSELKKITICKQCGLLFAQKGKETFCSSECVKERKKYNKRKNRAKKKELNKINN